MSDKLNLIYDKLSDKAKKEIESISDTIFVEIYAQNTHNNRYYNSYPQDMTTSVSKFTYKLSQYYSGYFNESEQRLLKQIFTLEKENERLKALEQSIDTIKQFINKETNNVRKQCNNKKRNNASSHEP